MRTLSRAFELVLVLVIATVGLQVLQPETAQCLGRVIGCLSWNLARVFGGY